MTHAAGRATWKSDIVHIESVGPDVDFRGSAIGNTPITYSDTPIFDAFDRLRVSNPVGLWDSQLQYDLHRIWWEDVITNNSGNASVAHDANNVAALLTVEASDTIVRQSRYHFRYQPGKSQLILCTFVMTDPTVELSQKVGYFDERNGIFLDLDGLTPTIVRRTSVSGSPSDNPVPQSSWSVDTMDGNGVSGISLDFSKSQILFIDLEWLGVGRVRVGFVVDGIIRVVHEFRNANVLPSVYMTTANLPIRYEMVGTASLSGSHTMKAICSQVSSEGGIEFPSGLSFSASNGVNKRAVTTRLPVLSIRPKATFNSIVNRGGIIPDSFSVFSKDETAFVEVVYGGALTGASFNSAAADSITEFDVAATAISGGISFLSDYIPLGDAKKDSGSSFRQIASRYPITLNIAGSHPTSPFSDVISICVTSMVAGATDVAASIGWKETR